MIFLVYKVDFDRMENREPISRKLLGYASDREWVDQIVRALEAHFDRYDGFEGGYGGAPTKYPKIEVVPVEALVTAPWIWDVIEKAS